MRHAATAVAFVALTATSLWAQDDPSDTSNSLVKCTSKVGESRHCAADTSQGARLVKSTGPSACLLGKSWGYDGSSVWVMDGCGGEFAVGQVAAEPAPAKKIKHFGSYTPGNGLQVANTEYGDLNIRIFTYMRYLNEKQLNGAYTNAFGQTNNVQQRQDIQVNKLVVYFSGWAMNPKFRYFLYVWSTNVSQGQATQVLAAGNLRYAFNDHFVLGVGISSLPGSEAPKVTSLLAGRGRALDRR